MFLNVLKDLSTFWVFRSFNGGCSELASGKIQFRKTLAKGIPLQDKQFLQNSYLSSAEKLKFYRFRNYLTNEKRKHYD